MPTYQTVYPLDAEFKPTNSGRRFIGWTSGSGELVMWAEQAEALGVGAVVRVVHADYNHAGRITAQSERYDGAQVVLTVEGLNGPDAEAAAAAFKQEAA